MACAYWQCVSTVTLAPEAAARIARPWLQKANAPFTGSLPGAGSQYPDVVTQVLSSSMRTDPGPATLSARLLAGLLVTVQLVTTTFHSVDGYAWLFGSAGAMVHETLSTLLQPRAVKSMCTCQETLSDEPPDPSILSNSAMPKERRRSQGGFLLRADNPKVREKACTPASVM